MSVAIVPMSAEFGYSDTTKGLIASAFSWGYMTFMIPAGDPLMTFMLRAGDTLAGCS
jgi:hypothetical protein